MIKFEKFFKNNLEEDVERQLVRITLPADAEDLV